MKKSLIALAAIATSCACCASAQADGLTDNMYVGGALGTATVSNQTGEVASGLVSAVGGSAQASESSTVTVGRIFAGYNIDSSVAFELGYLQSSNINLNFSGTASNSVHYSGSGQDSTSGFDYSVVLRAPTDSQFHNLFTRIGGTYLRDKSSVTFSVGATNENASSSTSGGGYVVGLGYDFPMTKNISARAECDYYGSIAGESNNNATVYSVGLIAHF